MWVLLLIATVEGEGSGFIHSERLGPYLERESCEHAAHALEKPIFVEGNHYGSWRAFCVPVPSKN